MSLIPNITCQRCHRQYPSFRSRCPHCGMKKPESAQRPVPEADSAVRDSAAARKAAENINWQMLIGGILLICIIVAVISIVSVNVSKHVDETTSIQSEALEGDVAATAVPTPTAAPTPTPTPPPVVTSLMITYGGQEMVDFTEGVGTEVQLVASTYPLNVEVDVQWSSSDEEVATVSDDGLVTITGPGACTIEAVAGGIRKTCIARGVNR